MTHLLYLEGEINLTILLMTASTEKFRLTASDVNELQSGASRLKIITSHLEKNENAPPETIVRSLAGLYFSK